MRFRLSGGDFPPAIVYKIYTAGTNVHYVSGSQLGCESALRDAYKMMGRAKFISNVVKPASTAFEPHDVATAVDAIRYTNALDNNVARLGGRNNTWRRLPCDPGVFLALAYTTGSRLRKQRGLQPTPKTATMRNLVIAAEANEADSSFQTSSAQNDFETCCPSKRKSTRLKKRRERASLIERLRAAWRQPLGIAASIEEPHHFVSSRESENHQSARNSRSHDETAHAFAYDIDLDSGENEPCESLFSWAKNLNESEI